MSLCCYSPKRFIGSWVLNLLKLLLFFYGFNNCFLCLLVERILLFWLQKRQAKCQQRLTKLYVIREDSKANKTWHGSDCFPSSSLPPNTLHTPELLDDWRHSELTASMTNKTHYHLHLEERLEMKASSGVQLYFYSMDWRATKPFGCELGCRQAWTSKI